jgi:hypothetical protein
MTEASSVVIAAVLEEVPVGLGALGEEAEERGQQVLEAPAGREGHPGGVFEAHAELDEELLGDGGEEGRATLGEVVVEEALGDLGDIGDLGETGVFVAGGGEDGAGGVDDLGPPGGGALADPAGGHGGEGLRSVGEGLRLGHR